MSVTWSLDWWTAVQEGPTAPLDSYGNQWFVEKTTGWYDAPAPRTSTIDRDGSDGVFDGPVYQPGRVITIDGWIEAPNQASLSAGLRRIRSLLVAGSRSNTLVCADIDLTLQTTVRRDGATLITPGGSDWADYQLLLFAPDSTLYSTTVNHVTTGLYSGASGRVFPMVFPMVYGALGNQGFATFHNAGNVNAYPTLTLTAPSNPLVNPQVLLVGGSLLRLAMTLNVGDTVVISLADQTVQLNGVASRYYTLTPDSAFFSCPPGDSQLLFTADSGIGAVLDVAGRDPYA